jgi:hypothetical protein
MAGTLTYQINAQFVGNDKTFQILGETLTLTVGDVYSSGVITAITASATALPLGSVASPSVVFIRNLNDTNFVTVYDDAAVIGKVLAGQAGWFAVPGTVVPKVQADTGACLVDFTVFD